MKEMKIRMGRRVVRFHEEGRDWRLPVLLTDYLVLWDELEKDLMAIVGRVRERPNGNSGTS